MFSCLIFCHVAREGAEIRGLSHHLADYEHSGNAAQVAPRAGQSRFFTTGETDHSMRKIKKTPRKTSSIAELRQMPAFASATAEFAGIFAMPGSKFIEWLKGKERPKPWQTA